MAELNVQVGNLWCVDLFLGICFLKSYRLNSTFLPQDKVSSFAGMSPQELLKETQRAAGDDRLTQWHEQLVKSGNDLKELKQVIQIFLFSPVAFTEICLFRRNKLPMMPVGLRLSNA